MNRTAVAKLAESNRLRAEAAKIRAQADILSTEVERELTAALPPIEDATGADSDRLPTEQELARARKNLRRFYPAAPRRRHVYFIQRVSGGPIKIGTAMNVRSRLSSLQIGSHEKLRILGSCPGEFADEKALHRHFAKSRVSGEWFEATKELSSLIAAVNAGETIGRWLSEREGA